LTRKATETNRSKTALVTGASSGIGLELTRLFAKDGYNLVLVSRNNDALSKLGEELREQNGISIKIIAKDLSVPSAPEEIYSGGNFECGIHSRLPTRASYGGLLRNESLRPFLL
jgi:short-subunit dehydrogenase